jgi:hypothetical protein
MYLVFSNSAREDLVDEVTDLFSHFRMQIPSYACTIFGQFELGPYHEMCNARINAIWPIVEQNLDVARASKR